MKIETLLGVARPDYNVEDYNIVDKNASESKYEEYEEEELDITLRDYFAEDIAERGENYYEDNHVLDVTKDGNSYYAIVRGNKDYNVHITVEDQYTASFTCDCPCTYPCKHIYAALIAISDKCYHQENLKAKVIRKQRDLESIISEIPAEELKKYILSPIGKHKVIIEEESFIEHFRKYYPKQKFIYYYNNLYNELVLKKDYRDLTERYISEARNYLSADDFAEVFKIIKAIIEAYHDAKHLSNDESFELLSKLGILFRITYRKANETIISRIDEWTLTLKLNDYYNNYYLEDMILSIN